MAMIKIDMEKREETWFYKCETFNRDWTEASDSLFMTELMGVSGYYKTEVHIPLCESPTEIVEILVTCNDRDIVSVKRVTMDRETGKVHSSTELTEFDFMAHYY